jgi:Arylsulfotransferase (ASST)
MGARAFGGSVRGLLALAVALALSASPASAVSALHVIPFPGTPDAAPLSQVIFSSLHPTELRSVTVTGSQSGPHPGNLIALPDGAGTAFVPDTPFTAGELVNVTAGLSSPAAGTASGAPGATTLSFSFAIATRAHLGPPAAKATFAAAPGWLSGRSSPPSTPTQSFRSAPNLHPPVITTSAKPGATPDDIFLAPSTIGGSGPMILDSHGGLLWFRPVPGGVTTNVEVQRYRGQPVLTWWQGGISQGNGINGRDVIMNRSYRTLKVLQAGYGYSADLHEFQLTPQGTALIDAYVPIESDLSSVGGQSQGPLKDCVIQELDVKTGRILWEWHALGHVPLTASYSGAPGPWYPWEYFHLNSIEQLPNGNLLISARNTWSVYEIDKQTGQVIWTLGGKYSSFKMGPGAGFEWQHDAHLYPDQMLSVFDDAADPQEESQSSAKLLSLNTSTMTAALVRRYRHSPPLLAGAVGSAQRLPGGDMVVGWGSTGQFSEYTPSGQEILNGSFPLPVYSYRVYEFPWTGQPRTKPSLAAVRQHDGTVKVYMSWNGATGVRSWRVLAGSRPGSLSPAGQTSRTGFETVKVLPAAAHYVAVQALDAQGKVLGTSGTRAVGH